MEKALRDTPTVERELGCSGGSASRLIMTRENVTMHSHADADEMIYVVAGEATLTVADKDQPVQAGMVLRGTAGHVAFLHASRPQPAARAVSAIRSRLSRSVRLY